MTCEGARERFVREAQSRESLAAELRSSGMAVISIVPVPGKTAGTPGKKKLGGFMFASGFEVEMGLRQLASMLKSGVTLLVALDTVAGQSPWRSRALWRGVADGIAAGGTFSGALEERKGKFGEIVVRLAEVGERSGELEHSLDRAADQLEARRSLKTAVLNALMYPAITVAMAVGVSCYLVVGVIPKLAEFLRAGGAVLPPTTQALMDFSDWLVANGLTVLAGIAVFVAVWFFLRLSSFCREFEDALLLRIPVAGKILRLSATALFSRSMQIMAESGVTLIDSLATAAGLLANRRLRRRIEDARAGILKGATLESSLSQAREFMPMLRRMAAVGEVTGSLPEAFGETARFHEMLLAVAVKRFGILIEPVMIAITGAIVGFVYIAFFMALFAIAGTN